MPRRSCVISILVDIRVRVLLTLVAARLGCLLVDLVDRVLQHRREERAADAFLALGLPAEVVVGDPLVLLAGATNALGISRHRYNCRRRMHR